MSINRFSATYNFVQKHKKLVIVLLGVIVGSSLIGLKFIQYNNNIELMLPADKDVQRSMRFLRESNFSDKLIVSLKIKEDKYNTEDLILATDQLIASIKSPLVKQVIGNTPSGDMINKMISFLKYAPQLLGPEALAKLETQMTPNGIKERLKFIYKQSLFPGSSFMMPFLRTDPLNLYSKILLNIQKLSTSSGYDVLIYNGHFVSRDGRHSMIILKSPVVLTEGFGARKIVNYLKGKIADLPVYVSADIIAGHMHTVSNEDVIKRDIRITSIIASVAFLLLFLFFFRDLSAVIIFLMPFVAVLISTNVSFLVFKNLSYFVIGMGTVIAGIAIDYGIYVYIAVRRLGNGVETVRQVVRPVIFGALTTISVFAAFFFSSVQGYHQLAFFSNFSIILCLVFSLFILPHLLKNGFGLTKPLAKERPIERPDSGVFDRVRIFTWLVVILLMSALGSRIRFNNDITQFDGTAKNILYAEEEFHRVWGGKELPAVFVVTGKSLEDAYEFNGRVYAAAVKEMGGDNFNSLASVWPGKDERRANLMRWDKFWTEEKESELKKMLSQYGKPYNFSADAFKSFLEQLHPKDDLAIEPSGFAFFEQLKEQFVLKKYNEYQIVSFFPDQDKYIAKLSNISKNYPGTFLFSRHDFSQKVSRVFSSELIFLSLLAISLTVALTLLLLKSLRLTILAMVPVITSLAMISGIIPLFRLSLNTPSIIAAMVVVGVVSDYGMFVVYYCKYQFRTGTYIAVAFAAITTLIGASVLLFAHHPILFSIGVTLVTGVLSGYISSLLVIPPLYRLWVVK